MKLLEAELFQRARRQYSTLVPFTDQEWFAFRERAQVRHLPKKEHFLRQGAICMQCAYIAQGYVRHYYLIDGKEVTNDFNFEGMSTGGYHSFISQTPARFNIVAMENTILLTFTRETLLLLYEQYPAWQKLGR